MYIHYLPERLRNSFTAIQVLRRFKQLESTTPGCYNLSQSSVFFMKSTPLAKIGRGACCMGQTQRWCHRLRDKRGNGRFEYLSNSDSKHNECFYRCALFAKENWPILRSLGVWKKDDIVIDHYHEGRVKKKYLAGTSTWLRVSLPQSLEKFKSSGWGK